MYVPLWSRPYVLSYVWNPLKSARLVGFVWLFVSFSGFVEHIEQEVGHGSSHDANQRGGALARKKRCTR